MKALNAPILLRPFHEMNGDWYSWAVAGKEQAHINAWRHMVTIFREEGATNVKWVWCPNERYAGDAGPYAGYYPGDAYVDYLGLDGYNWAASNGSPWLTFDDIYRDSYDEITALSPTLPVMLGEYGSHTAPGDKAAWIDAMHSSVASGAYPRLQLMVYFNKNMDGATWEVNSSPESLAAYKRFINDPYFQGPLP